jgi:hypothetical protein
MGDFQLFQLAAKMTLVGIPTTAGFRGLYIVGLHDLVGFHRIGFHRVALNLAVNRRSDYRKCRCFLSSIIIYHHLPSFIWISMLGKYFFPHTCHVVFFKFPSFLSHPLEAAELLDPGSWHPASSAWPRHPSVPLGSLPPGNTELPAEHGVGLLCKFGRAACSCMKTKKHLSFWPRSRRPGSHPLVIFVMSPASPRDRLAIRGPKPWHSDGKLLGFNLLESSIIIPNRNRNELNKQVG